MFASTKGSEAILFQWWTWALMGSNSEVRSYFLNDFPLLSKFQQKSFSSNSKMFSLSLIQLPSTIHSWIRGWRWVKMSKIFFNRVSLINSLSRLFWPIIIFTPRINSSLRVMFLIVLFKCVIHFSFQILWVFNLLDLFSF